MYLIMYYTISIMINLSYIHIQLCKDSRIFISSVINKVWNILHYFSACMWQLFWRENVPAACDPLDRRCPCGNKGHSLCPRSRPLLPAVGARLPRGRDAKRFHLFPVTCLGFILLNTWRNFCSGIWWFPERLFTGYFQIIEIDYNIYT
jgi:hypothetical protein